MTEGLAAPAEQEKTISSLCVDLLRDCRERLETPDSLEDEELVHDLRVATKRLRAAWQLVRELSGPELVRKRRDALRILSAHLAFRRDAAVLVDLARELAAGQPDSDAALILGKVGDLIEQKPTHSSVQPCPDGLFEEIRECLEDEIAAWERIDWSVPDHTRKAIRRTLRESVSRVRRDTANALNDAEPETWHKWRKAIKRLRYQREFVAGANGRLPGKFDARISRLGTALGRRNDLANLLGCVEREVKASTVEPDDLRKLRPVFGHAEQDLLRNCRRLGRRLLQRNR